MKSTIICAVILFILQINCPVSQAMPTLIPEIEVNAIVEKINAEYAQAYTARDVKAFTNLFVENATFLSDGSILANRKTLEKIITNTWPLLSDTMNMEMHQASSTAITSDVIVTQGVYYKNGPNDKKEAFTYTYVLVNHEGIWKITTTHISRLQ